MGAVRRSQDDFDKIRYPTTPPQCDSPLEAVKIMSGFSDEVATAVIQLE